ncbi:hypothetical protein GCM10007907_34410 [Chitinimonas prasina]|uniref:N-acetyltransferase domain-containing protein n=1 Tax=Chitinimonas prasina TaxID=1434937 RepID=A0ABQ5YJ79_9NEIS|nr:GNAT family N-acetyltransferase [Chitinimonas prasina]GLR14651.1 hypothetical protein GCM10007907_34410 [Chitinimonas prasina]
MPNESMTTTQVSLRPLTHANFDTVLALKVKPEQTTFVASNENTIAKAYLEPDKVQLRVIYADESPVGFMAYWCDPAAAAFHLLRFMLGSQHQRQGYGQRAVAIWLDELSTTHGDIRVTLYYAASPGNPQPFYAKAGFCDTGEKDGDEHIMALQLSATRAEGS